MTNALGIVSSGESLRVVWDGKKNKLCSSCFGVDRMSGAGFKKTLSSQLSVLGDKIRAGYRPSRLLAISKPKESGGVRIICVPTVADRLVQFSVLEQLRPRLHRAGLDNSISYGLARSRARSVIGARNFACNARAEHGWVYKTDIHKFFDSLDRDKLRAAVETVVPQRSLRPLIYAFLESEITDGIESGWQRVVSNAGIKPGSGVRQGMPLSPFFAGAYLKHFDRWLLKRGFPAARYVDDIVVFFDTEKAARSFHPHMSAQMAKLGLMIGDIDAPGSKTRLYSPTTPADFLGMQIRLVAQGHYRLCVSPLTFEKVGEKFARLSTVSGLSEVKVQLTTLGGYLGAVQCGYVNAYDGAHNLAEFQTELDRLSKGAKQTILLELFGNKLEEMTTSQRRFVGID